jgi:hypothetical protein
MSKPKILAYYLPQFHPIPENDKAWGNGFTEWTNLIRARPRFEGHALRTESLEFGQYDLRSTQVRKRHAELAKDHGVYGFVYYHYWFYGHSPEKVMYESLERMLIDGEPNIPFCFAWANEPWTKTWDGSENNVIIPQNYGDEPAWINHFNYLLDFFKHPNYILVDNKPVLQIYRIGHFKNFNTFKKKFNELAISAGFNGIHFIQMLNHFNDADSLFSPLVDAYSEFHPMYVNRFINPVVSDNEAFTLHDAVKKWDTILDIEPPADKIIGKQYYRGYYSGWDSSPRGLNRKFSIDVNNTPSSFEKNLSKQMDKVINDDFNSDNFLFMFAWNEWGEGAILEPDTVYRYEYLEAILKNIKKY